MADKKVVVFPTDFSETSLAALPLARRMAAVLDAQLHCVYTVEEPHIYATLDMGPVPIPTADELASSAELRLKNFVGEHLKGMDKPVVSKVLIGRPPEEIVNYARDQDRKSVV